MDEKDAHWVVGLVDGEGCFSVSIYKHSNASTYRIQPMFKITMSSADTETLNKIKNLFGVGNVYTRLEKRVEKPLYYSSYLVSDLEGIKKISDFFAKFNLRSKKKNDFEIWKQIVEIALKKHKTNEDYELVINLRQGINLTQRGTQNPASAAVTKFRTVQDFQSS